MSRFVLAAAIAAIFLTALAAPETTLLQGDPAPPREADDAEQQADADRLKAEADARWERLQAETAAVVAARRQAQEEYERGVREAEAARIQYEADMERHRAELERARLEQEDYQRRLADHEAEIASGRYRRSSSGPADTPARPAPAAAATEGAAASGARDAERPTRREERASTRTCEQQLERNRRRGRAIGSLIGGVASLVGGRPGSGDKDGQLSFVPAAEMLGEAIAGLLDCDEQERAAAATEEAVSGGVGTTARWTSETRPGVSGSSTVIALEQESGGGECMTVTDVIIVDGEETTAPKRLCRRPPSNRFVRV